MADLVIGAIKLQSNTSSTKVQFGEAVSAGDAVYFDNLTQRYLKANSATVEAARITGIAMADVDLDGYGQMIKKGDIDLSTTAVQGDIIVVSANGGGLAPVGDLAVGNFVTAIGIMQTTSILEISFRAYGITHG